MVSGTITDTDFDEPLDSSGIGNVDEVESFSYDDGIVRAFAVATLFWGLVATLLGLAVAHLLVIPKMFGEDPVLSFGRLRPLHTNAAIFAFVGNALFAAVYYSTQRLCKSRMWSGLLSQLHFWGWQFIVIAAAVTLPFGVTQGKALAELEWPIDLWIALVWIGFFGLNFFMTLRRRRTQRLHVSLWFYIVTIVTVAVLHIVSNVVLPIDQVTSYPLFAGVHDAVIQWCYGYNAVSFLLLMPFLGLMYYFLPKAVGQPIHSYRLAILHFWSLALLFAWAGPHRIHYTAMPEWVSSLGMLTGLMLWMPSWGGLVNGLMTLRSRWDKVSSDSVLKFFLVAVVFYGITTFESALLSIKSISSLSHYSDWTIAHVHAGAMGWNGMLAFGMIYWLMPRIFQTNVWSEKAIKFHFWIATIGLLLSVVPLYIAGFQEAWMWGALDELGNLKYPDFVDSINAVKMMWWLRIVGGLIYVVGIITMTVNFVMTWLSRPSQYEVPVHRIDPVSSDASSGSSLGLLGEIATRLDNAPVLDAARSMERGMQLAWHQRWERLPSRFANLMLLAIIVASVIQVVPVFLVRSNVPKIATVKPYTPLELAGREIYVAEGCYNCHSQMVRSLVAETKRYGDYSQPGEFIYDYPFQWGNRRIGPDLAREGVNRQTSLWHWNHLEDPTKLVEDSVMPSYAHLLDTAIDYEKIVERVKVMERLGVPYGQGESESDAEDVDYAQLARDQAERVAAEVVSAGGTIRRGDVMTLDSQAVALIAYLQRLGTDLTAPPETKEETKNEDVRKQVTFEAGAEIHAVAKPVLASAARQ